MGAAASDGPSQTPRCACAFHIGTDRGLDILDVCSFWWNPGGDRLDPMFAGLARQAFGPNGVGSRNRMNSLCRCMDRRRIRLKEMDPRGRSFFAGFRGVEVAAALEHFLECWVVAHGGWNHLPRLGCSVAIPPSLEFAHYIGMLPSNILGLAGV